MQDRNKRINNIAGLVYSVEAREGSSSPVVEEGVPDAVALADVVPCVSLTVKNVEEDPPVVEAATEAVVDAATAAPVVPVVPCTTVVLFTQNLVAGPSNHPKHLKKKKKKRY